MVRFQRQRRKHGARNANLKKTNVLQGIRRDGYGLGKPIL